MGKGLVPVPISAASAQMAARHLLNRKTGLLANFRCGSEAALEAHCNVTRVTVFVFRLRLL